VVDGTSSTFRSDVMLWADGKLAGGDRLAAAAARAEGRLAMKGPTVDTRPAWRGLAPLSGLPDSVGHATFVVLARREQVGDPVPLGTEQQSRDAPHTCHLLG
jgi:hypothetical protein